MRDCNSMTYKFPAWTYVAGGEAPALDWKPVPQTHGRFFTHVKKVTFTIRFTPTYASTDSPTVVGMNNVIRRLTITDGEHVKFQGEGGFNLLRTRERYSTGRNRVADADSNPASGTERVFRRTWHVGPPHLAGAPGDFLIPVGLMAGNGSMSATFATLAQLGVGSTGNPSAVTATIQAEAQLALLDHINLPPLYEYKTYSYTGKDLTIPGRCKLESIALLNSTDFDAWAAGDLGTVRLDLGTGGEVVALPAPHLTALYNDDFASGELGAISGEPGISGDDNAKQIDRSSPTAVAAAANDLQPLWWTNPHGRIGKQIVVPNALRITSDGSQATAHVAVGRILPRSMDLFGSMIARLGLNPSKVTAKFDTLSKRDLPENTDLGLYLPMKVKVR
ncbi:MAG TPA: hypothetical protein VGD39_14775 [Nocardioides sp.]